MICGSETGKKLREQFLSRYHKLWKKPEDNILYEMRLISVSFLIIFYCCCCFGWGWVFLNLVDQKWSRFSWISGNFRFFFEICKFRFLLQCCMKFFLWFVTCHVKCILCNVTKYCAQHVTRKIVWYFLWFVTKN